MSTPFSDFPQIGDRVSINILVTESASLSLASNRPDLQPYVATDFNSDLNIAVRTVVSSIEDRLKGNSSV